MRVTNGVPEASQAFGHEHEAALLASLAIPASTEPVDAALPTNSQFMSQFFPVKNWQLWFNPQPRKISRLFYSSARSMEQ